MCLPKPGSFIDDVLKAINSLRSSYDELIENQKILEEELKSRFDSITFRYDAVASEMVDMQKKFEGLHTEVFALESNITTEISLSITNFEVIQEFFEQNRCNANVIIHDLPESLSSDFASNIFIVTKSLVTIFVEISSNKFINFKLIRFSSFLHSTKLIFTSCSIAAHVLSTFRSVKTRSPTF